MANKYHRQGFVGAGLVKKLLTSKADKADKLMDFMRESKKLTLPKKLKNRKIKIKNPLTGKSKEYPKELLSVDEYIDIQNMSNNQLKKQIQKYSYIVGTKNKKLAERAQRSGSTSEIKGKARKK
jgi:hypothetical protein